MRSLFSFPYLPLLLTGIISASLLVAIHDVYWWPQDDGIFAYLAEALVKGGIYGIDVIDIHGGYHSLLNAWLFKVFGTDVVVLRYPLIVLGTLQALMITHMASKTASQSVAILAGLSAVTLGFIQFPNASPGWYLLFFAIAIIWLLASFKRSALQMGLVGVLVGIAFLFRHPSAAFISVGIFLYLLHQAEINESSYRTFAMPRLVLIIPLIAVITYSYFMFELLAFILFAAPLILVISHGIWKVADWNLKVLIAEISCIATGFFIGILPMIVYQLAWGDLALWFTNSFFSSANIINFPFFFEQRYWDHLFTSFFYYWASILALPLVLTWLWIKGRQQGIMIHPAFFIAIAFGLVSFYYQIPFYLYCSLSVFLLAVFVSIKSWSETSNSIAISFLLVINILALATQSLGFQAVLYPDSFTASEIPKVSLRLEKTDQQNYLKLISIIEEYSTKADSMFVFPKNPDLYFVTERNNPFPFYETSLEVNTEEQYQELLEKLELNPPRLFIFNQGSKYKRSFEERLFELLRTSEKYQLVEKFNSYWFFTLADA